MLKLLGAVAGAGTLGAAVNASATTPSDDPSIVVEQGDDCYVITPLSGEHPVEEFYDYRFPTEEFDSVSGSDGDSFSSEGTTHLQEDATSIVFLYDGPQGLSLVLVHGQLGGDDDGGLVTFVFEGLPADASWVVRDDYYLVDGEPAVTNYDRWDVDGATQQVDWAYVGGRTDGGAALGLGEDFEVTISPAFNDAAALAEDFERGDIENWEALTWADGSPDRVSLAMDEPITIRTGSCDEAAEETPVETPDDTPVDTPDDTPVETPDDTPVETPDDTPVETPDDTPVETPDDEPVESPGEGDDGEGC